jgi:two-component system, OmpR family, alkaline phosphatase synthesis response regulator PhoP
MKKRILLVEDEESLLNTLALNLEMEGYEVLKAKDGLSAFEFFKNHLFHLVILDIMMPGMNGLDLCAKIRKENRTVLILFLSARNLGSERVEGLRAGADDYLSKPFHLDELLLRVEILLRRIPGTSRSEENDDQFAFDGMKVDFQRFEFTNREGQVFPLTKKEAALLKLLIQNRNKAVSRDEILEKVWGFETFPGARTIDNFLINFRRYVGDSSRNPRYFQSVRGVGYMFSETQK